jgi:5-methylcytosine-specific restriction endonuclease McrA
MSDYKSCLGCGIGKNLEEFKKDKRATLGVTSRCIDCINRMARESYARDPNKKLEKNALWTAQNLQKHREMNRANGFRNKNKRLLASRLWYLENKDRHLENGKQWSLNNPEARLLISINRRARKIQNGVFSISSKEVRNLLSALCAYCTIKPSAHLDHVIPISRGGVTSIGNLIGSCALCNQSKGNKTISEWRKVG